MQTIVLILIFPLLTSLAFSQNEQEKIIHEKTTDSIFSLKKSPQFPGGEVAMKKFIAENVKYPQSAKEASIKGTVYVTFVVNNEGKVTDAKVLRGINHSCDEEALRVINSMPNWIVESATVSVRYTIPIRFLLQ